MINTYPFELDSLSRSKRTACFPLSSIKCLKKSLNQILLVKTDKKNSVSLIHSDRGTTLPLIKFERALISAHLDRWKAGIIFNRINRTKNEHLNIVSGNQKWTNSRDYTQSTLIEIAFNAAKVTQSTTFVEIVKSTDCDLKKYVLWIMSYDRCAYAVDSTELRLNPYDGTMIGGRLHTYKSIFKMSQNLRNRYHLVSIPYYGFRLKTESHEHSP